MIINDKQIDVKASGSFESTDFRIDPKYMNKMMWLTINQYRHKVRTPVQEIISNARDAQRENGNPDRPIKIQLPTRLESTFIVRDYGVGMNEERIKTIFTSFGASTKSSSNEQTGGFGIGAKSPLAYTDSFNIKTYVDGKYWFYVVAKTSNDGIGLNLLDSGETTEENGTEIQIPVNPSDVRTFVSAACRCTMFWEVQPIFNLDKADIYVVNNDDEDVLKISNTLTVYKKSNLGNLFDSKIVLAVDGIPYEIDRHTIYDNKRMRELEGLFNYGTNAVIKINTGDIDLLQTRESIDDTDKTEKQLTKIGFKAYSEAKQYMDSHLNKKCLIERYKQYKQLCKAFNNIPNIDYGIFKLRSRDIEIPKGLTIYYYDYKGRSRGFVKNPQKHFMTYGNAVTLDQIEYLYWDNLKDESANRKARRLRYKLQNLKDTLQTSNVTVMVIEQGSATNFEYIRTCRMLKAAKLSDLPYPPKSATISRGKSSNGARKLAQGKVMLNVLEFNSYDRSIRRKSKEVELSTVTDKYIYDDYSNYDAKLFHNNWYTLISDLGYTIALVSKKYAKNVAASDKFTSAKDFFENFKVSEDIKKHYVRYKTRWDYYGRNKATLCKIISDGDCKDQVLNLMVNILGTSYEKNYYYNIDSYPSSVIDEIKKDDSIQKRIDRIKSLRDKFEERLQNKYPMTQFIDDREFNYNKKQVEAYLVDYINAAYRSRQCK